jgi:Flp pilus assembly protein TadD
MPRATFSSTSRSKWYASSWHRLGNVLERKRDAEGARHAYEKALELDPNLKEASDALAKLR